MTLVEAVEVLKSHNAWRRGELDDGTNIGLTMQNPVEIGQAIDVAIEMLEFMVIQ